MSFIDYNTLGMGVFMTGVAHPLTYCKVLIQLGHEPLAPVLRRNFFFRKQLQYPNIYEYMKHIKDQDGFFGLYRGLQPRLFATVSTSITYMAIHECMGRKLTNQEVIEGDDTKAAVKRLTDLTCREMTAKCCAIIVSHPFHVIAVRSMAQFVGHETYYCGFFSSVKEIYNEEGIFGFFVGLIPRLAAEIVQIWVCNVLAYLLNTYILNDKSELGDLRQYSQAVTSYIASVITYPITLTSTVAIVSGSRLAAGNPPYMQVYSGWWSCLKDLKKKGLSNRGSSLFFRPVVRYAMQATSVTPMPPSPPIAK